MKASSEAARTSRVRRPDRQAERRERDARPPPARPARAGSGSSRGPRTGPARQHQQAHRRSSRRPRAPPSRRAARCCDTRPRTSRENAFSSRSSASVPAASSSVMNISDTAAASATANDVERACVPPFSDGCRSPGSARPRRSARRPRRTGCRARAARTRSPGRARRARRSRRQLAARLGEDRLRALQAEHVEVLAEEAVLPPLLISVEQLERLLRDALGERARWRSSPAPRSCSRRTACLAGSSRCRRPRPSPARACDWRFGGEVLRDDERGRARRRP